MNKEVRVMFVLRHYLKIERGRIDLLRRYGGEEVLPELISIIVNHHTDQHSRILAIEAAEKVTGIDIGLTPGAEQERRGFIRRFVARRAAEQN